MPSYTKLHRGSLDKVHQTLLPIDKTDLVGYWPFWENSGTTLYDEVNGNDGTIYGACLPADTLIKTVEGGKPINEITDGDSIYSYSKSGICFQQVKDLIFSGRKRIYELKTGNRTIRASNNHPFLVPKLNERQRVKGYNQAEGHPVNYMKNDWDLEWIPLEDIKEGMGIVTFSNLDLDKERESSVEFMQFVGAFLGGGSFHKRNRRGYDEYSLGLYFYDLQLAKEYKEKLRKFDVVSHIDTEGNLLFYDKEFGTRLEELDLGHNVYEKFIPSWIWQLSKAEKESLIQGMIDSDGWELGTVGFGIKLANESLLRELRELCMDCGYRVSNIQYRERESRKIEDNRWLPETESWMFSFHPNSKKDNSEIRINDGSGKRRRVGTLELPIGFELQTVSSIEPLGIEEVFDLEIPNYHNFIADGVVAHNSWTWLTNFAKPSLDFDGMDNYVDQPYQWGGTSESLSVSMWFNTDVSGIFQALFRADDTDVERFCLHLKDTDVLEFMIDQAGSGNADYATGSTTISTGTWYYVVAVFDSSDNSMELFLGGSSEATGTADATGSIPYNLYIGARNNAGTAERFFDGTIHEVLIYNRALSSSEITSIYEKTKP